MYSWVLFDSHIVYSWVLSSVCTVGFCLPFVQLGSVFRLYSWVLSQSSVGVVDGGLDGRCCIVVLAANAGLDGRCCIVVLAVAVVLSANAAVLPFNRKQ